MHRLRTALLLSCILLLPTITLAQKEAKAPACAEDLNYSKLDFWLGAWEVFDGDKKLGDNRIEKILDGCAVMEHWQDTAGTQGKSLFYLAQVSGQGGESHWKQVWITDYAAAPGGTKEKTLVRELGGGGLRFQGQVTLPEGRTYLDRTTLTPEDDGTVRQRVEISTDGGGQWRPVFDAIYRPKGGG